jgi:GNAT superfamily N-acetyltransferase
MYQVLKARRIADELDWTTNVEELSHEMQNMPRFDIERDMLFAEVDDQVVAYCFLNWRKQSDGTHVYRLRVFVHPDWRHKGIGTALQIFCEDRARQIAAGHPADAPKIFRCGFKDKYVYTQKLLEGRGYRPERYFFSMERPIDAPLRDAPMPEGLEIRPVKAEHIDAILDANYEAFRDHWGHSEITEADKKRYLEHPSTNPDLWKVAWDGDEVAGMVLNEVFEDENRKLDRKRGYTEDICVRRPWRKRGLASALIAASIRMFRDMGFEETALGVDTENMTGALGLYESFGYRATERYATYQKVLE